MNHKEHGITSVTQKQFVLILLALIIGLAFLDLVSTAQPGLDPSWGLALTKAHSEGLVWGKDIIFTYGSLGYLFFGRFLGEDFLEMQLARYIISFLWVFLSLRFIFKSQSKILQRAGLLTFIILPILCNLPEYKFIVLENKFILIIQLLIIEASTQTQNSDSKISINLKPYLYGILSIFFLLVKFNFGVLTVVCYSAIAISNLVVNRLNRSNPKTDRLSFSLNWLLLGYLVGLIIFFSPLSQQPLLALLIACCPGAIVITLLSRKQSQLLDHRTFEKLSTFALLFLIIVLIIIHPQIKEFIFSSLEITKGYSQSMGIVGNSNELAVGIVLSLGILILGVSAVFFDLRNLGGAIALLILALMSFKHGFVRQDVHVLLFAFAAPAYLVSLGALVINRESSRSVQSIKFFWIGLVTLATIFALSLGLETSAFTKHYDLQPIQSLAAFRPAALTQKISSLIHPHSSAEQLLSQKRTSLAPAEITSPTVLAALQEKTFDVQPWEVSLIEANNLKWQPAPIFQSYSAYTRWLDKKNLAAYQAHPPDKILYSFLAIDSRHPYFDQPQTTLFTQCHYQQQKDIPPLNLPATGELVILEKRSTPLCTPKDASRLGKPLSVQWNEEVQLNPFKQTFSSAGHILILKLNIQYSLLGKLYNAIYRTPPIYIAVTYQTGRRVGYRIVPDTAKSGLIVGNLPLDLQGALRDFDGVDNSSPVRSLSVVTLNQKIFTKKIAMSFWDLKKQAQVPADFDPIRYLELHPDVRSAGVNPQKHYVEFGFFEGRRYK